MLRGECLVVALDRRDVDRRSARPSRGLCKMRPHAPTEPNFPFFLAARACSGFGTGAESAIIAPFLSEFVPAARRGWFVGTLAGFFSFGFVAAAFMARFVVAGSPNGWRIAQLLTALPIAMLLWWRRALPESPRYLLA